MEEKTLETPKLNNKGKYRQRCDLPMLALVIGLCLFGLIMVFSASYYTALSKYADPYRFLISDGEWMLIGFSVMFACIILDYHVFRHLAKLAVIISGILLVAVLTPLGTTINNASRWIYIGNITIMPGEIAKTSLLLFTAKFYSDDPENINRWFVSDGNITVIGLTVGAVLLILRQPNLSTAVTVIAIVGGIMVVAGFKWVYTFALGGTLAAAGLAWTIMKGSYQLTRITTMFDPFKDPLGDGYQVVQSLLALGSGGIFGVGLGKSVQKTLYLPEPQSDFILSIIGEELGYVGVLCLMTAYIVLIWRIVLIAIKAPDYYGMLLASGVAIHLGIQVIFNVGVISASLPATGVVLPFISLGGNATVLFLAEMGMVLNISRQIKKDEEEV